MRIPPVRVGKLGIDLAKGTIGSFALKASHSVLGLAVAIVLARVLEPEGYSLYAFAFSTSALLAIPVQMGLPTLITREVARYHHAARWDLLRGILQRSNQAVLLAASITGLTAAVTTWLLMDRLNPTKSATFLWALLLLPLTALNALRGAALRGLRRVVLGQIPEMLLQPSLLLGLLAVSLHVGTVNPPAAMALYCASTLMAFLVGAVMLLRALPARVRGVQASYDTRVWVGSMFRLSLLSGLNLVAGHIGIFMLGLLGDKEDAGFYRVANSLGLLVTFALTAMNTVLAPHVARLYHANDMCRLQRMLTISARVTLLVALFVGGVLTFFGAPILGLVFGDSYRGASGALAILCVGQVVNAGVGSAGLLLNMTDKEGETLKAVATGTLVNLTVNVALIPFLGDKGAAAATTASLITWNLLLCRAAWRRMELCTTAFRIPVLQTKP